MSEAHFAAKRCNMNFLPVDYTKYDEMLSGMTRVPSESKLLPDRPAYPVKGKIHSKYYIEQRIYIHDVSQWLMFRSPCWIVGPRLRCHVLTQ
jgi:hypothetical protein